MILRTASTAIGDNNSQLEETTFELKDVFTQSIKISLFDISTGIDKLSLINERDESRAL